MKVISAIGKIKNQSKRVVLAIGVFDGVHIGHQALIKKIVKRAKKIRGEAWVMTFSPHPINVLNPAMQLPMITTLPHRLKLMERLGVVCCIVVPFTRRFSRLKPQQFIKNYLAKRIKPKEVFIGDDFRFGQDRVGTLETFRDVGEKFDLSINVFRSLVKSKRKIGSSVIRHLISDGKLNKAKCLLGRYVSVMGIVEKGEERGRKMLGFPTANIYPGNEVIPPVGVYAAKVHWQGRVYDAMANVGRRPSFSSKNLKINIEVHLFDFRKNLYGKEIIVDFIKKIRQEKTFNQMAKLVEQLQKDEIQARQILRKL